MSAARRAVARRGAPRDAHVPVLRRGRRRGAGVLWRRAGNCPRGRWAVAPVPRVLRALVQRVPRVSPHLAADEHGGGVVLGACVDLGARLAQQLRAAERASASLKRRAPGLWPVMLCSMRATSVRLWPLGVGRATSTRSSFPPKPAACMASSITIVHSGRSNRQLRKSGDLCGATGHVH